MSELNEYTTTLMAFLTRANLIFCSIKLGLHRKHSFSEWDASPLQVNPPSSPPFILSSGFPNSSQYLFILPGEGGWGGAVRVECLTLE